MARSRIEPPTSYVRNNLDGSTTYVGALATKLHRAMQLRGCLASPVGGLSTLKLLVIAQAFTGRHYGLEDRMQAVADLDDWIAGMEMIVPEIEETA